ncbi:MAG: hypothetical protein Q4B12_02800 [Bowdeniella nasicola]|nr:hypothetical protein [Bowdeniella nasicola]
MDTNRDDFPADEPDATFQGQGNDLASRLAQEEPEDDGPRDLPYDRAPGAVGQLVAEPDNDGPEDEEGEAQDVLAQAYGKPRRDASAEEAAMHWESSIDESQWYDAADEDSAEDDDDDAPRRDDSAADFAFDEDEDDELA